MRVACTRQKLRKWIFDDAAGWRSSLPGAILWGEIHLLESIHTMSDIWVVGSLNIDLIVPTARFPSAGETVLGGDLGTAPGGKGANQACAAARLGARTFLIAQAGKDSFGQQVMQSLQDAGVDTASVGFSERSTGSALICVRPDGENTIVISPGANATLDPARALAMLTSLRSGDIVLLQLEIPVETVEAVASYAHACGATVMLDPAPVRPLPHSLLKCIDFLTPNQSESAALLGIAETALDNLDEVERAAAAILAMGPRAVILKLGARGCFLAAPEGSTHIAAFPVTSVDSTAAGDVFNGAFAVALSEGRAPREAAVFASAASALSITRPGAQSSIPDRAQTDHFLLSRMPANLLDTKQRKGGSVVRNH